MVQLSRPFVTTEKTIALTRQIFVGKVTSVLFNRLSKLVKAFFPRSKPGFWPGNANREVAQSLSSHYLKDTNKYRAQEKCPISSPYTRKVMLVKG